MSEPYTPDEHNVRAAWIETGLGSEESLIAEFDRWLAGVKAEAWDEAVDAAGNHIFSGHPGDLPNPYRREAQR